MVIYNQLSWVQFPVIAFFVSYLFMIFENKYFCLFPTVPQKITQVNVKRTITARLPSLSIAWSVPESEPFVHYYQVDYGQNTSGSWKRWSPDPNTTSVTITDLLLGTHYIVRVRAVSEVGIGSWSNEFGNATYDGKKHFCTYI